MFTGLVRDVGTLVEAVRFFQSLRVTIETSLPSSDLQLGASVACNGACLTIVSATVSSSGAKNKFEAEIGPETMALTRFGLSQFVTAGTKINLEPSLRVGDALGGHYVSGHVDTLGEVVLNEPTRDGFWKLKIRLPQKFTKYVILKGSVAISGVSLTIAQANREENWLEIMLIPHTLEMTNLSFLKPGDCVEMEFDSQVKTVAELLAVMLPTHLNTMMSKN